MSLFTDPTVHAANPPHTWEVTRGAHRVWNLHPAGHPAMVMASFPTRAEAVEATRTGFSVELWDREARWYRGDTPPGWRPYRQATVELDETTATTLAVPVAVPVDVVASIEVP